MAAARSENSYGETGNHARSSIGRKEMMEVQTCVVGQRSCPLHREMTIGFLCPVKIRLVVTKPGRRLRNEQRSRLMPLPQGSMAAGHGWHERAPGKRWMDFNCTLPKFMRILWSLPSLIEVWLCLKETFSKAALEIFKETLLIK